MLSDRARWAQSIVRVGGGRGFVVGINERFVITAAHCLPEVPPPHRASYIGERTFEALLGEIGQEPTVWAECLFVDPIADLAVLVSPDGQELYDEASAFEALIDSRPALPIGNVPLSRERRDTGPIPMVIDGKSVVIEGTSILMPLAWEGAAWMLSLEGHWFWSAANASRNSLIIPSTSAPVQGGMSGSPIMADDGSAIGVVCNSAGPQADAPLLAQCLPVWLLSEIAG